MYYNVWAKISAVQEIRRISARPLNIVIMRGFSAGKSQGINYRHC